MDGDVADGIGGGDGELAEEVVAGEAVGADDGVLDDSFGEEVGEEGGEVDGAFDPDWLAGFWEVGGGGEGVSEGFGRVSELGAGFGAGEMANETAVLMDFQAFDRFGISHFGAGILVLW